MSTNTHIGPVPAELVVKHLPTHYQLCLFLLASDLDGAGDVEEKLASFIAELNITLAQHLEK